MPDNPVVPDLLKHAASAIKAQTMLREAMAAVAREIKTTPPPPPEAGKSA